MIKEEVKVVVACQQNVRFVEEADQVSKFHFYYNAVNMARK